MAHGRAVIWILTIASLVSACGTGDAGVGAGQIGIEDADALYATLTDDLDDSMPRANAIQEDPDPPGPAGGISPFRSAVQLSTLAYDADGRAGVRLLFAPDATPEQKRRWLARAERLSLNPVEVLTDDDPWPNCAEEPDCTLVGETLSLG